MRKEYEKLLKECNMTFFLSSGPGGQRRDRKRTAVRLLHVPSGIVITCSRRRSRRLNLEEALSRLVARLEERRKEKERKPRIATKRPAWVKEAMIREKRHRSLKKKMRRKVTPYEE